MGDGTGALVFETTVLETTAIVFGKNVECVLNDLSR